MEEFGHFIDGESIQSIGLDCFTSIEPHSGKPWAKHAFGTAADVDRAVAAATTAQRGWAEQPAQVRARKLWQLAEEVRTHAQELAELESRDIGKVLREMRGQMRVVPQWLRYFGGISQGVSGRTIDSGSRSLAISTRKEPMGVVAIIPPFNSPVMLTVLSLAPALATGNTVVIKPSEHASASIVRLAALSVEAGLPPGIVNVVTGDRTTGEYLANHPGIDMIAFTGGVESGRSVASSAARGFKKAILELGGKSASIVFQDAPMQVVADGIVAGIFAAAGQTCVAGSRLLVQECVADQVIEAVTSRAATIRLGNPLDENTDMGPLARRDILDGVKMRVNQARADGAQIFSGGIGEIEAKETSGWFFPPTIVTGASNESPIAQEELFGPVLTVIPFNDEEEAVCLANSTRYGLAAGVWTTDIGRAHRMARDLEAGTVWVNTYRTLHYGAPFGGRGESGMGLVNGEDGLSEFLRTKSIFVETNADAIGDPFQGR